MAYGSTRLTPARYATKVCGTCGKEFECSTQTRYKVVRNNRDVVFCSYRCFREVDRPMREAEKAAANMDDPFAAAQKEYLYRKKLKQQQSLEAQEEKLVKRIKLCDQKVREYRTIFYLTNDRHKRELVRIWALKKMAAEDELRLLRVKIMREKTRCTKQE